MAVIYEVVQSTDTCFNISVLDGWLTNSTRPERNSYIPSHSYGIYATFLSTSLLYLAKRFRLRKNQISLLFSPLSPRQESPGVCEHWA